MKTPPPPEVIHCDKLELISGKHITHKLNKKESDRRNASAATSFVFVHRGSLCCAQQHSPALSEPINSKLIVGLDKVRKITFT